MEILKFECDIDGELDFNNEPDAGEEESVNELLRSELGPEPLLLNDSDADTDDDNEVVARDDKGGSNDDGTHINDKWKNTMDMADAEVPLGGEEGEK